MQPPLGRPSAGTAHVRQRCRAAAACAVLALGGCMTAVPVAKTDIEQTAPVRVAAVVVGQTDRTTARQQLGEPWLSSDVWRFDLFRAQGRDVSAPVMFVFWWPVPLGVAVDKTTSYVLLSYDANNVTDAEAHGLAVDPSVWSSVEGPQGGQPATGVQLDSGDLEFGITGNESEQYLSVEYARGKAYLDDHPWPDACRLVLGFAEWGYGARVALDDGPGIALPEKLTTFQNTLLVLKLPAGPHRLEMSPLSALQKFEAAAEFNCGAGETRYGVLSLRFDRTEKLFLAVLQPGIEMSSSWPAVFDGHRWLVWGNGRWLLPMPERR